MVINVGDGWMVHECFSHILFPYQRGGNTISHQLCWCESQWNPEFDPTLQHKTPRLADVKHWSTCPDCARHSTCQEYGRTRCLFLRHGYGRVRLLDAIAIACAVAYQECVGPCLPDTSFKRHCHTTDITPTYTNLFSWVPSSGLVLRCS